MEMGAGSFALDVTLQGVQSKHQIKLVLVGMITAARIISKLEIYICYKCLELVGINVHVSFEQMLAKLNNEIQKLKEILELFSLLQHWNNYISLMNCCFGKH